MWLGLGWQNMNDAIQPLAPTGDLRPGDKKAMDLRNDILTKAYIDWLIQADGGVRTATEVLENRELRLMSLGPLIANIEVGYAGRDGRTNVPDADESGLFPPTAAIAVQRNTQF